MPTHGMWDAVGPDAEPDEGTACAKGVGTTAVAVLCPVSAGGTDLEGLVVAEEGDCETGICEPCICSAIAVVSCSATSSCFDLLSKAINPFFFFLKEWFSSPRNL